MREHRSRNSWFATALATLPLVFAAAIAQGVLAAPVTILDAKRLPDGAAVELAAKIVSAAFSGFFYATEDNGSAAIRVTWNGSAAVGQRADISGTMSTNANFERQITASSVLVNGAGQPPAAPGLKNREVGGDRFEYNPESGAGQRGVPAATGIANNVGRLVRTSGMVMMGAPGDAADFPIDDGTHAALLVVVPAGVTNPGYGAQVAVTGISSLRFVCGVTRRAILLRGTEDLQVVEPPPVCRYGGPMVYVAEGDFDMGVDYNPQDISTYTKSPKHRVYMDGYWIGKYEVTRGEYRKFVEAGGYENPQYWTPEGWWWKLQYRTNQPDFWTTAYWCTGACVQTEEHPVVGISPFEMDAYCKWAGVRRTTECEWEKAAGWDPVAQRARRYPWGDVWDIYKCNHRDDPIWPYERMTSPVGLYPDGASYYGCMDMAGNVNEWCRGYATYTWYSNQPEVGWINPQGEVRPEYDFYGHQAYRGGGFFDWASTLIDPESYQCQRRFCQFPYLWNADIGLRVAR